MNEPDLPGFDVAAALALVSAPCLVLALRRAGKLLPIEARPVHRWSRAEILAVCTLPFALFALLAMVLSEPGVVASLLLNELVFGLTAALAVVLAARHAQGLASLGLVLCAPLRAFLAAPLVYVPWVFAAGGLGIAWTHLCRARGWEEQQEILQLIVGLEHRELVLAALVAVFVGPLLEELLFRGFLQSALTQAAGERGGLVLSSALFAAMHGVPGLPVLFSLSLFLGWLQQRTRCLLVPFSAHALHNAVQLALALLALRG